MPISRLRTPANTGYLAGPPLLQGGITQMDRRTALTSLAVLALMALGVEGMCGQSGGTSRIAFTSNTGKVKRRLVLNQVVLMKPDGSGRIQLTNEPDKDHQAPSWSPDALKISAFVSDSVLGGRYVKIIDVATGNY